MLPPESTEGHRAALERQPAVDEGGQRDRAGALGHRLLDLEQQEDGVGDLLLADGDDLVDVSPGQGEGLPPTARTAMPSAIVSAGGTGPGSGPPARARAIAGISSACTPMTRTEGRRDFTASPSPPASPPPPTGTSTASRAGT